MDYINKKLSELKILMSSHKSLTGSDPHFSIIEQKCDNNIEESDIISLPSCSKSEDESHSNGSSNGSTGNSISSFLKSQSLVKRSTEFRYQDAVRSATYSKSEFVLHALQWHNILRSHHGVPPLMLSLDLCQKAQFWANHLSHTETFYHMNDPEIGQNLLSKWTYYSEFDPTAEEIVKYWYNYIDSYNFDLDARLLHTQANHFTQLIWKSSTHFGIGKARTRQGKMIVVANYTPPGNVSDHFAENVPPPLFGTLESRRNTAINATLETNRKIIERSARKLRRKRRLTPVITTISGSHIDSSL